ncbi:MAG: DegT/DnrJ/EryC1/StrS family aminotransferase [Arcobacter sp.]|uniref:DegT/DnrJ/EryC1/StrS family aminotransferase n=1 Tax=Arcobacter sp. TaxID=1872629 RepID=UPI003C71174B
MGKIDLNNKQLAINGGSKVRDNIWQDNFTTGEEEKVALSRVIDSGYLSLFEGSHTPDEPFSFYGGPEVQFLEKEWKEYYECNYAVSVNSATSGLYMAIGALEIGYGDEVIVSPYTMSACALAPMIYGAIPVFADVDDMGSLDPKSIKKLVTSKTKAILVVHQFGIPAQMDEIMSIAKEYNIKVIEDCAQAHGAKYKDKYVGTIGDIGVFSLNVNKTIQSGEGGICVTNDEDLHYRLALIRNHGEAVVGPAGYDNITNIAGFNYRMTELQAAVCRVQLLKLDHLNEERVKLVKYLNDGLNQFDFLVTPKGRQNCINTHYVYSLRFLPEIAGISREEFIKVVNAEGIMFYQGYVKPLYFQPMYQRKHLYKNGYPFSAIENKDCRMEYDAGTCPNAEKLHFKEMIINEHIRLPHTIEDIEDIIKAIKKVAEV